MMFRESHMVEYGHSLRSTHFIIYNADFLSHIFMGHTVASFHVVILSNHLLYSMLLILQGQNKRTETYWTQNGQYFTMYSFPLVFDSNASSIQTPPQLNTISSYAISKQEKSTIELHLSGLTGMASHPNMQNIQIIGFFFEKWLHWQSEFQLLLFTVCTYI
jgi:hypothetical protein